MTSGPNHAVWEDDGTPFQVAVCIHVRHSRKKWAMNRLRRRQEQGQQKGRVEIQGVERMKLPALHFLQDMGKRLSHHDRVAKKSVLQNWCPGFSVFLLSCYFGGFCLSFY